MRPSAGCTNTSGFEGCRDDIVERFFALAFVTYRIRRGFRIEIKRSVKQERGTVFA